MSQAYKIKLQNFEGPLDLLLFFVRKDELNVYDIPIARITKSYLEYLQLMTDLNLDIASEFILMAATLMRIKAKSMLPPDPTDEEEEEMMDPREELSRRLIEYRQFKEASKTLSELDEYWRTVYRRTYFNFDLLPKNEEEAIGLKDISFFDLLTAYKKAMEKKPKPFFHRVERLNVTIEQQTQYIMEFFRDRNCYLFTELCEAMDKIEIVVTFLALLDLVKKGEIAIRQASIFDDIWIYKASEFQDDESPEMQSHEVAVDETNVTTDEIIHPQSEEILSPIIDAQATLDNVESEVPAEQVEVAENIQTGVETISNEILAEEIQEPVVEIKNIDEQVTDTIESIQQEVSEPEDHSTLPEDHSTLKEGVSETDNSIDQSFGKAEEEQPAEDFEESYDAEEKQRKKEEEDEIKEEEKRIIASYFPEVKSTDLSDVKVDEPEVEMVSENVADVEYEGESKIEKIELQQEVIEPISEIENHEKYQVHDIAGVSDSSAQHAEEVTQSKTDSTQGESVTETQEPAGLVISSVDDSNQNTSEVAKGGSQPNEEIKIEETPSIQKDSPIKNFFKKIVSFVKRIFSK